MKFKDRIYGKIEIKDQLIVNLIRTAGFQRLKNINQYGGVNFVYKTFQVTRFEHSIGVWWILKTLKVPIEVQVAGLLHDIGHTAFSHMVDRAMKNKEENFHQNLKQEFVLSKDVANILKKYNLRIHNPDLYPEIKGHLGNIGADKIDYAVRDYYGAINRKTNLGLLILKNIRVSNQTIVFGDIQIARKYATTGLKAMWRVIYDPKVAVIYQSLTEIIRLGLRKGWLNHLDLIQDDKYVFEKIIKHKSEFSDIHIKIFLKPFRAEEVRRGKSYDFLDVKLKARYFDPFVEINKKIKKLSALDRTYKKTLTKYKRIFEKRKKGVGIRVIFTN